MLKRIFFVAFFAILAQQLLAQVFTFSIKVPRLYVTVTRVIKRVQTFPCPTNNCMFVSTMGYNTINNTNNKFDIKYNDFSAINNMSVSDSIVYKDTLDVIDYNFAVSNVNTDFFWGAPVGGGRGGTGGYSLPNHETLMAKVDYNSVPKETVIRSNGGFTFKTIVEGIVNTDISRTLPSHDSIRVVATSKEQIRTGYSLQNNSTLEYKWYYSVDNATNWQYIPSSDTSSITLSGIKIFGNHYNLHINKTVFLKTIVYNNGSLLDTSNVEPFTHRLSAPKIIGIDPVHVNCWGDTTGSFKVYFNRSLLSGEKLNFLLKDTFNIIDYNVLNVNALASDSSLTWPVELLGGTDYQLSLIGKYVYNGINGVTYTSSPRHFGNFHLNQPEKFMMYAFKRNEVLCKGGNSGATDFAGLGGTREYKVGYKYITDSGYTWTTFNNPYILSGVSGDSCVFSIGGFKKGTYFYKFRDANNCLVKENGFEKITSIEFKEPVRALSADLLDIQPITSSDSLNGKIVIRLAGGTPFVTPQPYTFEWKDSASGATITNYSLINSGGIFETSIKDLTPATYSFIAKDANYLTALPYNNDGCKLGLNVKMVLPLPLQVNIFLKKQVSCVDSNNAEIVARATGGVKENFVDYYYKWFKQNNAGVWQLLSFTDSVLTSVSVGNYKVEVKDKYSNLKMSVPFTVANPPALLVSTTTISSTCFSNADGAASAFASGGTPPYRYEWSNGVHSSNATQLAGGSYIVFVKDTMGCETIATANITSPVSLLVNKTITPVICNSQCNAAIQLATSGGTAPYAYLWSTGTTSSNVSSLCSGQYWVKISDNNNCVLTDTIVIESPAAFSVSAGPDREICYNHKINLDATVVGQNLTYLWSNSYGSIGTTPTVTINNPGTYVITGTSSNGCIKKDTCYITPVSSYINTDFVVSSQAFANSNTLMVNLSDPRPVQTQWIVPNSSSIQTLNTSNDYCELKFADTGVYNVTMKVWYASGCIDEKTKKIIVTSKEGFAGLGNQANALLQNFRIYPNPSNGNFTVQLQFNSITQARLRLINTLSNVTVSDKKLTGSMTYNEPYNLSSTLTSGVYILMIETARGNFIYKVIIN